MSVNFQIYKLVLDKSEEPEIKLDIAHQAPLSMKFSSQEYWSELPFPSPGDTVQSTHCSMASIVSPRAVNSSGSRALGKEAVDMWE